MAHKSSAYGSGAITATLSAARHACMHVCVSLMSEILKLSSECDDLRACWRINVANKSEIKGAEGGRLADGTALARRIKFRKEFLFFLLGARFSLIKLRFSLARTFLIKIQDEPNECALRGHKIIIKVPASCCGERKFQKKMSKTRENERLKSKPTPAVICETPWAWEKRLRGP